MAIQKLTIEQAKANSANFMYVFAGEEEFLRHINQQYAAIIRVKKANQNKLLRLSAKEYGKSYEEYTAAVREGFIEQYGMTPGKALVTLAQGGSVAGKNWSEGVFGVGAIRKDFNGFAINDQPITVDPTTGHIFMGTTDITDESKTVYQEINKKTVAYQLFSKDMGGFIFMSQYYKLQKKYGAQSYADGQYTYSAKNGKEITASDNASVWSSVLLSLETFWEWLISLFGGSSNKEQLSTSNTLPNQQTDGFVYQSGFGEAGGILLLLAAGGAALAGGLGKKKKKSNK